MLFDMNKNILDISLFSVFSSVALFSQESTYVNDVDLLTESINISTNSLENSALTQEQINKLDETTRILLADYQSTSKEYESLKLYNDQVQKIINSQLDEIENILFQIDELDKTNQKIAAEILFTTTLISIITIPILAFLLNITN